MSDRQSARDGAREFVHLPLGPRSPEVERQRVAAGAVRSPDDDVRPIPVRTRQSQREAPGLRQRRSRLPFNGADELADGFPARPRLIAGRFDPASRGHLPVVDPTKPLRRKGVQRQRGQANEVRTLDHAMSGERRLEARPRGRGGRRPVGRA